MASERLKVAQLEVRGSHFLSEGEVRELLGPRGGREHPGRSTSRRLKARLRASPWVADATVARDAARHPARRHPTSACPWPWPRSTGCYLMDEDGGLIELYGPRTAAFDLPIVRGPAERRGGLAPRARAARGRAARDLGRARRRDLRGVRRALGRPARWCSRRGEVLLFGSPPYRTRFVTFLSLRRELAERCAGRRASSTCASAAASCDSRSAVTPSEPAAAYPAAEQKSRRTASRRRSARGAVPPLATTRERREADPGEEEGSLHRRPGHRHPQDLRDRRGDHRRRPPDVIGIGQTESKGLRKGVVDQPRRHRGVDQQVLEEAELMAGCRDRLRLRRASPATHIKGFNSRGVIAVRARTA